MNRWTVIDKKVGETPLQALTAFRNKNTGLLGVPLTYAGRLDPMAEGKLLILIGNECKNRKKYDGLDKEYEFELLLGVKSDTEDILGLAESCGATASISKARGQAVADAMLGIHAMPYPAYSSKTVAGKQLFQHAHENTLDTIEIPTRDSRIYRISCFGVRTISDTELFENIFRKLSLLYPDTDPLRVGSDFRINDVRASWQRVKSDGAKVYTIVGFRAIVSSGTYVRTIAALIAEKFGTCGLAYLIRRTKIGRYLPIYKRVGFWWQTF